MTVGVRSVYFADYNL